MGKEIEVKRAFEGIWIPREIWLTSDLTLMEKLVLVEIKSLDNWKECFARNEHFAKFFGIGITRVGIIISALVKKGYIERRMTYAEGTKHIIKRTITVCVRCSHTKVEHTPIKVEHTPTKVEVTPPTKVVEPTQQKLRDNNTVNNTKVISTVNKQKAKVYFEDPKLNNLFIEFLDLRKELKAKNTDLAIGILLKKLDGFSTETRIEMIEQSIEGSWKRLFPIKKQFNNEKPSLAKKYFPEMFEVKGDPFETNLKLE